MLGGPGRVQCELAFGRAARVQLLGSTYHNGFLEMTSGTCATSMGSYFSASRASCSTLVGSFSPCALSTGWLGRTLFIKPFAVLVTFLQIEVSLRGRIALCSIANWLNMLSAAEGLQKPGLTDFCLVAAVNCATIGLPERARYERMSWRVWGFGRLAASLLPVTSTQPYVDVRKPRAPVRTSCRYRRRWQMDCF